MTVANKEEFYDTGTGPLNGETLDTNYKRHFEEVLR